MTQTESKFFRLVDKYARDRGFFLAEFFQGQESNDEYALCFRPANDSPGDADPQAWRYVNVPGSEVRDVARLGVLPTNFTDLLNHAFTTMRRTPETS